jgi:hypothetical protein
VFFQHILPQKTDAVKSTERLEMLLTEIESTGIGSVISSSSKVEQEPRLMAIKIYIIAFILISY